MAAKRVELTEVGHIGYIYSRMFTSDVGSEKIQSTES